MADITLRKARTIIATARKAGQEAGYKPLSVVVLDAGGHVIAFERADGASPGRFEIARGKAYGAVMLHMGGNAQRERADQVGGHFGRPVHRMRQRPDELVEGLVGAEVLLPLVAGKFQRHDRHGQAHGLGEAARIVLDQFRRAGGADDHGLWAEALVSLARGAGEEVRRIRAQISGLEGRVGHRRAMVAPLDHREEKIGVGVALGRMKHVVQALHPGRHAHRADMGRAFVCPHGQLHSAASSLRRPRRRSGRAKSPARSPACS